ncbi:MAG: histidine kinase [Mucilaginibacter polytrichastri]|nr:histidine kinase [Mucilaginibacter polytrichastri]
MYFFSFLAAVLLIRRLQRMLNLTPDGYKWKTLFNVAFFGTIAIAAASMSSFNDEANLAIGSTILLGIALYVRREDDFQPYRYLIPAVYPLIAAGYLAALVSLVLPDYERKYSEVFQFGVLGAFIWIYARWATSKKQTDELQRASLRNMELDRLVAERTAELTRQKNELQQTVELLQATQEQLIQQEKLASLGELTAGIAHEIQNPLNFVNNFSEVSMELADEMAEELRAGNADEAIDIAADIKTNLEKICQHGRRADGIVKGMLQHSRKSTGMKELVNINAIADEYLRLAYHGLRAKDKSFNAEMVTDFSEDPLMAEVIPQDMGRVLLNLFTNAFYATHERRKTAQEGYKPLVKVWTGIRNGQLEVRVRDNGTGIPESIRNKILQPFFTTKPAGEGTGLGLSLSYDMIAKVHGGSMDIESVEGEYTEFTVSIPLKAKIQHENTGR